ncbi:MAG: 50S ribosomal protein L11 methyltransferase [Rhodoferax sp.]|nr:50S ribosomal protein L11 methyltransferase [Rhodoferax sp.]MCP5262934.1 50S ribosomal protein L11 methyltransferase [Rhodoferax sp.]MCW5628377.1 50S ribosomal protein L11 methyltransferase [Rhodoferax sp.]MCW5641819.1 50S ribosomal protein L11 methyltransferase [Rhodoferax sp.]
MVELSLRCPQDRVEDVSDALQALDAQSVSVEDADALTDAEQALFGEPGMVPTTIGWRHSTIKALFADDAAARDAARILGAQDFFADCTVDGIAPLAQQDWVRLTQSQFEPVAIEPDFWIVPTWHQPPAQASHVIRLDPGLAFGTGTHPTTRMCLQWIARNRGADALGRVLDYGCGSGILAIAAAMFGATAADALDIDPAAVTSARDNAQANGVRIACGLPDQASGQYQTVLANILATPLKVLAPLLCARVAPGGSLVLSGILERQADELTQAYAPHAALQVSASQEGWILMTARL